MYKFVVIYYQVDDSNLLEDFFSGTHLRLIEQWPGLQMLEISRITGQPTGQSRFHLMVEAYFENETAMRVAQLSETGRELMEALRTWADERLIAWFYADSFSESKRPD
ncbi:MAG: EthD family reductase [Chloroflexota bacterium]|jgi:uncharacterized protein (TIGR02118 family)